MMGIPVKVYRSTDKDAPQLTSKAGEFKTIIKACLVTGYGEGVDRKEPLGWEIIEALETEVQGVFRAKEGEQHIFNVVDNGKNNIVINAAFDVLDNTLVDESSSTKLNLAYANNKPAEWWLVGHGKAFYFCIAGTYASKNNTNLWSVAKYTGMGIFFGEPVFKQIARGRGNSLIMVMSSSDSGDINSYINGYGYNNFPLLLSKMAASVDGNTRWIDVALQSIGIPIDSTRTGFYPVAQEYFPTIDYYIYQPDYGIVGKLPIGKYVLAYMDVKPYFIEVDYEEQTHLLHQSSLSYRGVPNPYTHLNALWTLLNLEEWAE